jgi:phosphate transport system protein
MDNSNITGHISSTFNDELLTLSNDVLAMGDLVREQIRDAVEALNTGDPNIAEKVIISDHRIDTMELKVDEECTRIIARRQPAAGDLRFIMAMIKTVTDLERMGDEAERIGHMAMRLADAEDSRRRSQRRFVELTHLGNSVLRMADSALHALRERDTEAAAAVVRDDLEVDHEYEGVLRQVMTYMMDDPRSIPRVLSVMWAARSLERIGDRARNICEYVIYLVKGKDVRHTSLEDLEREAHSPD